MFKETHAPDWQEISTSTKTKFPKVEGIPKIKEKTDKPKEKQTQI